MVAIDGTQLHVALRLRVLVVVIVEGSELVIGDGSALNDAKRTRRSAIDCVASGVVFASVVR